jgi:3-oxoacyl-(acyl-carrier-protein) synthase
MRDTILITGLGVVSPIGIGIDAFWNSALQGIGSPGDYPHINPAYVPNRRAYYIEQPLSAPEPGVYLSRADDFAIRATEMCLQDAGLDDVTSADIGVSFGTGMGNSDLLERGREEGIPIDSHTSFGFSGAAALAAHFGFTGPNLSTSTACSASGYSLSLALEALDSGWADVMVVGGAEGFSRIALGCFNRLGALDPVQCRPFDQYRAGTVFGEGGAMMVLETAEHARRRGCTRAYAEVKGYGWSCDGHHATAPEPSGQAAVLALSQALAYARVEPEAIDCVVPHGTGTELNDLTENDVLVQIFAEHVDQLKVCAIKSMVGHTGGAAGAFSCLTAALILSHGMVPPTAHLETPDPRCQLRLHREEPVTATVRHVLVNAYAFGGNNVSIIFGQPS